MQSSSNHFNPASMASVRIVEVRLDDSYALTNVSSKSRTTCKVPCSDYQIKESQNITNKTDMSHVSYSYINRSKASKMQILSFVPRILNSISKNSKLIAVSPNQTKFRKLERKEKAKSFTVSLGMLLTSPSPELLVEVISTVTTVDSAAISGNSVIGKGLKPSAMAFAEDEEEEEERRGW